jgi:hypothetical protein
MAESAMQTMNRYKSPSTEEIVWWGRCSNAAQYKIQEIIRILSNLDAQHNLELDELQRHALDGKAQEGAVEKLRTTYQERRRPYVRRLEELRERGGLPAVNSDMVPQEH